MKKKLLSLITHGALVFTIAQSAAAVVLIDFGDAATDPTLGGTWNTIPDAVSGSGISLLDTGGIDSGIDLAFDDWATTSTNSNAWSGGDKDWVDDIATADYLWRGSGSAGTVTLSGLDDNLTYDISLVSVRATDSGNRVEDITVEGSFTTSEVSSEDYDAFVGHGNRTILNWTGVEPVSGSITLSFLPVPGGSNTTFVNAMQITVPEPGTFATLAGLLVLGFVMIRRRLSR